MMDRTFEHNVDAQIISSTGRSTSLINVVNSNNKNDEHRARNRIAADKTRQKKKQLELETRQRHKEKEEQNRRLKDMEVKQRELINVMLNEIMVKKVENFFDGENILVIKQKQATNEHNDEYKRHADGQQESIIVDNDFNKDEEIDLQNLDFSQAILPSSLIMMNENNYALDTTTQYSIEVEDKEEVTTATTTWPYTESKNSSLSID